MKRLLLFALITLAGTAASAQVSGKYTDPFTIEAIKQRLALGAQEHDKLAAEVFVRRVDFALEPVEAELRRLGASDRLITAIGKAEREERNRLYTAFKDLIWLIRPLAVQKEGLAAGAEYMRRYGNEPTTSKWADLDHAVAFTMQPIKEQIATEEAANAAARPADVREIQRLMAVLSDNYLKEGEADRRLMCSTRAQLLKRFRTSPALRPALNVLQTIDVCGP